MIFMFHFMYGMSSFPLTNLYFSRWLKPPTSNSFPQLQHVIAHITVFSLAYDDIMLIYNLIAGTIQFIILLPSLWKQKHGIHLSGQRDEHGILLAHGFQQSWGYPNNSWMVYHLGKIYHPVNQGMERQTFGISKTSIDSIFSIAMFVYQMV